MLTVIVLALLVGLVMAYIYFRTTYAGLDFGIVLSFSLFAILGGMLGALFAFIIGSYVQRQDVVVSHPICSYASAGDLKGKFVIAGSDGTGPQDVYNFMELKQGNVLKPQMVLADDNVKVVEDRNLNSVGYWEESFNQPDPHSFLNILALQ
jgi:hypothetical protein